MAPTPSSRSNFTLIRTPQSKQRLNFHSKPPNPDGSKDPTQPEHPVEVIGRIRDYPDRKEKPASILQVNPDNQTVRVRADVGYRDFTLDGVSFSEQEGLEDFYKTFIEERIKGVKVGNKCTIMMYGPTGAGKSHTMFGCGKEPGIVYRSLRDILGDSDQEGVTFVQVSVLEVYNEEIYDLLSTNSSNNLGIGWPKGGSSSKVRLEVMGKKAKNASFISGTEAGKISKEIVKVEKRRIVKSTLCNERSSRSHCMIILDVPTVGGRLMLVDMAGSENIDQAGQTGFEAKMQTAKINQGNIALKRVVESIANGDSHVPFRDSKLTMLLQDSFEDDKSKILMILCASPDPKEMHKTLCTLEYGAKAKCIVRGSHTPYKDKNGGDESAVILGSRIAAMDEFICKLQTEKKQKEKERNDAQKQLKKKEEEVAALRSLLTRKEVCATNEEAINEKVNERTQLLKSELDKKLEECRRMAEEFVEMERRRMEERIVQQQEELEMMRRRLEEIEVEFRRSREGGRGSVDETSGFAKRLRSLYSDDDPGMVKSMDLDMGDPEPVKQWGAVSNQSSNTISRNFTNLLQPKPSENMLPQMYPDRVCLSTVFEEDEVEDEEEKVIVEDKSICSMTTHLNSEGLGKENCFNNADDKESASSRRLRIQNIFTLCGNQRELSQHIGQDDVQAKNASPDKLFPTASKAEALVAEDAKENNILVDESKNGQIDVHVKWEATTDNPRKQLIATLKVTKDATLADLRKLIEIYLGSDNEAFTFLKLGEPCGAQVAKEKESTVQATSLPFCNGHAYLATLRPGKSSQLQTLTPASPLPLTPIENKMQFTPISRVTPNHQVDEFSSPNLAAHLSSTPFITLRRH
ncbi:Kinesin-like protein KIN-10A [Cardamine amara subsp. amara]|uniref:Kinesin-like protein KIN-10A n=1 Tax=Cardamine amara subsp. amara TaxID=228776 RepID=A0ABD1AF29_CARAN